jgi:hypothetical protein
MQFGYLSDIHTEGCRKALKDYHKPIDNLLPKRKIRSGKTEGYNE